VPVIGPQHMTATAQGTKLLERIVTQFAGNDMIDVSLATA